MTSINSLPQNSMRSTLFSNSAIYLVSNILNASIPFLLLPVLTRYLSADEYGQVAMFQAVVGSLTAFIGLNVNVAAGRKYYDDNLGEKEFGYFLGACLQILFITSTCVFFIFFIFKQNLSDWLGLRPDWVLWAVAVSAAGFIINLRLGQWQIRGMAFRYGSFQVSQSFLSMLLSLFLVVFLLQGADGRILAQSWMTPLFAIVATVLLIKDRLIGLSWRPNFLREALQYGIPLIPHVAGFFLLGPIDRLVINAKTGVDQVGIYMVAVQIGMAMAIIFDGFNKAYVPWLFERLRRDQLIDKIQIIRWTYAYFIIVLIMAVFGFILGPFFVTFLAGERYIEAGKVIGLLTLGQAFYGMYLMVTNYIFYSKRTGLLSIATITSGLINFLLLIVLVDYFGIIGAGMAFAISMIIRFLLTWRIAQRCHPMPWLGN